ncbi:MAG: SGNH/GDSL hydrolase family protein [Ruminococcaceae bacterium]|nr:SGNH/GDSL hydrolase family protein [Oscillospiraceae bacterium]
MELKGKKINFLGDSITEGVGTSCQENIYHQVMKREYGLAEARNYGISGTRFARQPVVTEDRFDRDFCMRVPEMDPDADVVVVFGGTNDFGHGAAPIGGPDDRNPDTFYGACHYLFRALMERYPEAVIVICTPLHRLSEDSTHGDVKTNHPGNLKRYVDIIREVAELYSLPVVDFFARAGIQPKIEEHRVRYMPDGLHPNDAGHRKLAERIGNFLLAY